MKLWELELQRQNVIESISGRTQFDPLSIGELLNYGINNITDEKGILKTGIYDQDCINCLMQDYEITNQKFDIELKEIKVTGELYEDADGFTCFKLDYESSEKVNELIKNYTGGVENE